MFAWLSLIVYALDVCYRALVTIFPIRGNDITTLR